MKSYIVALIALIALLATGAYLFFSEEKVPVIGGDRDERGCLIAAGYGFDEEVGACIRSFELDQEARQVARQAVEHVGESFALTVVSFESYEDTDSYEITLERGVEREQVTVYVRDGRVQTQ